MGIVGGCAKQTASAHPLARHNPSANGVHHENSTGGSNTIPSLSLKAVQLRKCFTKFTNQKNTATGTHLVFNKSLVTANEATPIDVGRSVGKRLLVTVRRLCCRLGFNKTCRHMHNVFMFFPPSRGVVGNLLSLSSPSIAVPAIVSAYHTVCRGTVFSVILCRTASP